MALGADEAPRPAWDTAGIHGLHRVREWDVVTTVEVPEVEGERAVFVVLSQDEIVVEEGPNDVEPLAEAIERELPPPYRAEAVRREAGLWAVAARKIETIELPGVAGRELELVMHGGEHTLLIDGERQFGSIPVLERPEHVTRARRIDGEIWEIEVAPL
jgi:hypothetical protein